jgi:25S rRNA (uracil2634-N3)-methyltransferase
MGESSVDKINGAEKRIQHYSSSHKILLVGEGDFSFAACLAKAFGTAANMTATSFDSKGIVSDCNILPLPISL